MSKTIRKSLVPVLLICLAIVVLLAGCKSTENHSKDSIVLQIEESRITVYGNVGLSMRTREFFKETGFEYGDAIRVRFLDKDMVVPIVSSYTLVDIGETGLIAEDKNPDEPSEYIELFINLLDFAKTYGIADKVLHEDGSWECVPLEGVEFPIDVTLTLEKKGAYPEFAGPPLVIRGDRESYNHLDDYGFANIRMIKTTGFGNCFYRGSSPLDDMFKRNKYADDILDDIGVDIAINLANTKRTASEFEGYADTYYYKNLDVVYIGIGIDYSQNSFRDGLRDAFKYIADNRGVYYIHCQLGKDRTGIVCAILESLMGASVHEVVEDYMQTYLNYYDIEKDSPQYNNIAESNICVAMKNLYNLDTDFMLISDERLHEETVEFLKEIGLTDNDIANLKANLARVR